LNKKLEEELVVKHPTLYQQYGMSPQESCMCWGFECGNGWFDIIKTLSEQIEPLGAIALQVKEKFGGLRFYYGVSEGNGDNIEKIQEFIDKAEIESYKTCEQCGKEAKTDRSNRGWIVTVCENCRKERYGND
jgi:hypothetical protein